MVTLLPRLLGGFVELDELRAVLCRQMRRVWAKKWVRVWKALMPELAATIENMRTLENQLREIRRGMK